MAFTVRCEWDADANVWYVEDSDVPGLAAEAPTIEAMEQLLTRRVPELLKLNMPELAQRHTREPPSFDLFTRHRLAIAC